jgi:hypothetical protein
LAAEVDMVEGLEPAKAALGAGESLWWLDTGWACGAVIANEKGVIVDSAPIFKKPQGLWLEGLPRKYRVEKVKGGAMGMRERGTP